jgi:hypothetical protein
VRWGGRESQYCVPSKATFKQIVLCSGNVRHLNSTLGYLSSSRSLFLQGDRDFVYLLLHLAEMPLDRPSLRLSMRAKGRGEGRERTSKGQENCEVEAGCEEEKEVKK